MGLARFFDDANVRAENVPTCVLRTQRTRCHVAASCLQSGAHVVNGTRQTLWCGDYRQVIQVGCLVNGFVGVGCVRVVRSCVAKRFGPGGTNPCVLLPTRATDLCYIAATFRNPQVLLPNRATELCHVAETFQNSWVSESKLIWFFQCFISFALRKTSDN